jgi:hypothetical protein
VFEIAWREVQRSTVVPERHASRLPLEPHRVLGTRDLLEQQVEHVPAFAGREVDDFAGERRIDVHDPFLGLRMYPNHGMNRGQRVGANQVADLLCAAIGRNACPETVFGA